MNKFTADAENGDPVAQYKLALHLFKTAPQTKATKIVKLLRAAAEQNHADAAVKLAEIYEQGIEGTEPDSKKAIKYFKIASRSGNPQAWYSLGVYAESSGVRVKGNIVTSRI